MFFRTVASVALLFIFAFAALEPRQGCSSDYRICAPVGVTRASLGPVGPDWANLFSSIINAISVSGNTQEPQTTNANGPGRREMGFCCSDTARCLTVDDLNGTVAMCWDRFTTNVYFSDGVYGTVVTGNFTTPDGDNVDLVYGDYTMRNGQKGNIYATSNATTATGPNTTTMLMPSPWTSKGIGSAIPATELGTTAEFVTITTVIPATTIRPSTAASITLAASRTDCGNCSPNETVIPGPTQPGTTRPASTSIFTTGIITPPTTRSISIKVSGAPPLLLAICALSVAAMI